MHGRWTAAAAMWCHCVAAAAIFKNVLRQIRIFMNNLFILLFFHNQHEHEQHCKTVHLVAKFAA